MDRGRALFHSLNRPKSVPDTEKSLVMLERIGHNSWKAVAARIGGDKIRLDSAKVIGGEDAKDERATSPDLSEFAKNAEICRGIPRAVEPDGRVAS